MEGEALVFHCNVSVTENALSVNWWHIPKGRVLIAGMDQDGRLNIGSSYLERRGDIRLEKVLSSTFVLTIYNTSARQDTGLYHCEMTEWSKGRSWKHTQEISTTVKPWGKLILSLSLFKYFYLSWVINTRLNAIHYILLLGSSLEIQLERLGFVCLFL